MYAFDIKESGKQSLSRGKKNLMPENSKKEMVSVGQFLKPNYPNMFRHRKKDAGISENSVRRNNTVLQHEANVMGKKTMQRKYFSAYSIPINNFNSNQPIQRKLVFRGKEKKANEFVIIYNSNSTELDEFTASDGGIKKISEESLKGFIQVMVDSPDSYYIGNKNNIVDILTEMYYKIERYVSIPSRDRDRKLKIIKLAIDRMYNQANNIDINDVKIKNLNYSQDLIDAVMAKIASGGQNGLLEYELRRESPGAQSAGAGKTVTDVDRGVSHYLKFGKYVYRTMNLEELGTLTGHSTYSNGKYTISAYHREMTIGKHVGNLTQAVTYSGVLVRFEMKPDFNRVILNQIKSGNEGTHRSGSIGMKYENEGMLKGSAQSSFSFYIPSGEAETFLSNVVCFEVFNLGKTVGGRRSNRGRRS